MMNCIKFLCAVHTPATSCPHLPLPVPAQLLERNVHIPAVTLMLSFSHLPHPKLISIIFLFNGCYLHGMDSVGILFLGAQNVFMHIL